MSFANNLQRAVAKYSRFNDVFLAVLVVACSAGRSRYFARFESYDFCCFAYDGIVHPECIVIFNVSKYVVVYNLVSLGLEHYNNAYDFATR